MGKTEPQRKCIGCDQMIGKKGLLRIVRDKEGNIFLDPTVKKNGRGAYICNDIKCFEAARKRKAFERSLKCRIPDQVYDSLRSHIEGNSDITDALNAGKAEKEAEKKAEKKAGKEAQKPPLQKENHGNGDKGGG